MLRFTNITTVLPLDKTTINLSLIKEHFACEILSSLSPEPTRPGYDVSLLTPFVGLHLPFYLHDSLVFSKNADLSKINPSFAS